MKKALALVSLTLALCTLLYGGGPTIIPGSFNFSTFSVAGTETGRGGLSVEGINDSGTIVGYQSFGASNAVGYLRKPTGAVVTLQDPTSTGPYAFTEAFGVNNEDTVVGYYWDTTNNRYSGFFYNGGNFRSYNVPGLPAGSFTYVLGINDLGVFCGFYQSSSGYKVVPYVNWFGYIDTNFPIAASTATEPASVNIWGQVAGYYYDSSDVIHGFLRDTDGKITVIDVPGASTTAYTGTILLGLNDSGWTSGHFIDSEGYEHGFVRAPDGEFYQIDVPEAVTATPGFGTSGGGINNEGVVVGHYDPSGSASEVEQGYIAYPRHL
jgi:hypothetical protein